MVATLKYRNSSDDTVLDYVTQQVVEPDEILEVDADLAEHYEDHPVWEPVPNQSSKSSKVAGGDKEGE